MDAVVITGATSMIGVATIEACLISGVKKIYAVIRPDTLNLHRLPKDERIIIIKCGVDEYNKLPELIQKPCDVFYHIAWSLTGIARNYDNIGQAKNIQYTLDALMAAKLLGCKKFIGAGSQAEYGKLAVDKISEDSPVNPVQSYGIAKYAAGKLGAEEAKKLGIDFFWIRIFSVYGKYDKSSTMISSSIRKLLAGEKTSFTAAEQRWDYLYSEDAGRAFWSVGEKSVGNKVYCLGSGQARPLYEYIEIMGDLLAPGSKLGIGEIPYTSETVMNLCADISRLSEDTGWKPMTNFEDGIRKTVQNYQTMV